MELGVYVGRFQPFHNGHLNTLMRMYGNVDKILILKGISEEIQRTKKNPFQNFEIQQMILDSLPSLNYLNDFSISSIYDSKSDNNWYYNLLNIIKKYKNEGDRVTLFCDVNDESSKWIPVLTQKIRLFSYFSVKNIVGFHGTDVREIYFNPDAIWQDHGITKKLVPDWNKLSQMVPLGTLNFLKYFAETSNYLDLVQGKCSR